MPYNKMLRNVIAKTNYTNVEIVKKLNEKYNITLTEDHLNKVINGHRNPLKEETSRAIAKICNTDERLLVLEGYFDNAPEEIKEVFYKLYEEIYMFLDLFIENIGDKKIREKAKELQRNETMAETMIWLLDIDKNVDNVDTLLADINSKGNFEIDFSNIEGMPVTDNAMKPLITTDDRIMITPQKKYNNGDIVLLEYKEKQLVRQIYEFGFQYVITCINKEYKQQTINKKDMQILGRVTKKISKL